MAKLSPAGQLVGRAVDTLFKDPTCQRIVLSDQRQRITAIVYHGDDAETIIACLKMGDKA